jgi:pyruvate oxidase
VARWRCAVCNFIYDEGQERQRFEDLPRGWVCPVCGAPTSAFRKLLEEEAEAASGRESTTVAEKILDQLSALGIEYVFGIPGHSNLPLIEALRKHGKVRFILTRHEETAAFMASAYGKITERLGACLSIAGPGATNLVTGLMDAASDGAPVLALTGQVPQPYLGSEHVQEIDEIELFGTFSVFSETVATPAQALRLTVLAAKKAYAHRGVAHLSLPTDVLDEGLAEGVWRPERHLFFSQTLPPKEELERAVRLIEEAQRPVILAGWGIRRGREDLLRFAERISAPVVTTSRAKGVIPETHGLALGVLGAIGTAHAARAIRRGDLLIVLGSGFRQRNLMPEVPVLQVDIDGAKIGKSFPVEVGLVGDARLTVRELLERVSPKEPDEAFFRELRQIRDVHRKEIEADAGDLSSPLSPGYLIQGIHRHAARDAFLAIDVGDHTYWFYKNYLCREEETLLSANLGSMAFALPAALTAQLVYPDRQVICIAGDGGFGMLMADFTTAVAYRLPVNVVLFHDGKLKNISKEQEMYGYPDFGTDLVNPHFADFASSCGGLGIRVEKAEELDAALEEAFSSDRSSLVEVLVDPRKMAPHVTRVEG